MSRAYQKEIGTFVGPTTGCQRAADGSVVGKDANVTISLPYHPVGKPVIAVGYVPAL